MKLQDIVDRLIVLGLDEQEAGVYVHLSIMGPSKASDVAAALKLHRTEAYRTLQTLVQRGFAAATLSRPAKFEAAPPEKLFQEILATLEQRSERVRRAQDEIAPALTTLRGQPGEALSRNTFKILQGRREIYSVLERMVREAQREIKTITTHPGAISMSDMSGIMDVAVDRARTGLALRSILATTPEIRQRIAPLLGEPNAQFRHIDAKVIMRSVVVDNHQMLMWVVSDPSTRLSSEGDVAVWSDAEDFVLTESYHFDALWATGKDVRTMLVAEGAALDRPRGAVER